MQPCRIARTIAYVDSAGRPVPPQSIESTYAAATVAETICQTHGVSMGPGNVQADRCCVGCLEDRVDKIERFLVIDERD